MQQVGALNRRRSYSQINPQMPQRKYSEEDGIRTNHKHTDAPQMYLKYFKRKQLLLDIDNHQNQPRTSKKSDKKNTSFPHNPITKNKKTLVTMVSENENKFDSITPQKLYPDQYTFENMQKGEMTTALNTERKQNQNNDLEQQSNKNDDLELQGYIMGGRVDEYQSQEQKQKNVVKFKSFALERQVQNNYDSHLQIEAQARMKAKYWEIKHAQMKARKQDCETLRQLNTYKMRKQKLLMESQRKFESMKALANLKRSSSLPKINLRQEKCQQIIVPSYEQLYHENQEDSYNADKKAKLKRIHNSLSILRFSVDGSNQKIKGSKNFIQNVNNRDHNKDLQTQFEELSKIERHLRSKGASIPSQVLKKSLLNIKNYNVESQNVELSEPKRLISNPLFIKKK